MSKTLTQEEFLTRAVAVHGSRYGYSQTVYLGTRSKVKIICSIHGEFEQMPVVHLHVKGGCQMCGRVRTTEARNAGLWGFLKKAHAAHSDRYDYSLAVYANCKTPLKIICSVHGEFEQTPDKHAQGKGCGYCGNSIMLTQAEFLKKARTIHGDRYDYSQAVYAGGHKKLTIICSTHGEFEQEPNVHHSGSGCPSCGNELAGRRQLSTLEYFLQRAWTIHGDRYDYSQAVYAGGHKKLTIICSTHGEFEQEPNSHSRGRGCPICKVEMHRAGWIAQAKGRRATLYFVRLFNDAEQFYKVGITFYTVGRRYASQRDAAGYQYEVLAEHISLNAAAVWDWEQSIIETFRHLCYRPENRSFAGGTECFSSCEEILAIFPL